MRPCELLPIIITEKFHEVPAFQCGHWKKFDQVPVGLAFECERLRHAGASARRLTERTKDLVIKIWIDLTRFDISTDRIFPTKPAVGIWDLCWPGIREQLREKFHHQSDLELMEEPFSVNVSIHHIYKYHTANPLKATSENEHVTESPGATLWSGAVKLLCKERRTRQWRRRRGGL